jgi:hypothetical protein
LQYFTKDKVLKKQQTKKKYTNEEIRGKKRESLTLFFLYMNICEDRYAWHKEYNRNPLRELPSFGNIERGTFRS